MHPCFRTGTSAASSLKLDTQFRVLDQAAAQILMGTLSNLPANDTRMPAEPSEVLHSNPRSIAYESSLKSPKNE